ncbi:DUF4864 domain-containing protein [Halovulum dunhuangense]|uniref:DUF4864 domain-containing protein n=1 Tax=Halovulum dunhuangense TaxID=1505036 RepID=A0A849L3I8_9RHOB|nr:DUF4864 domain-containing protein [Halovulum dunhuangense]NNU80916.1 DUF4864 domain-containing protein [Halovulum dunhuangense]
MRKLLIGAVLALGLGAQAGAQSAETEIQGVISGQIEAFQADDFVTAFDFASPSIQGLFGTPENFGRMVMNGYPMVWRPADVRFAQLSERAGRLYQTVLVTDQSGQLHLLEYEMVRTEEGWEINGVQFQRPGALGA